MKRITLVSLFFCLSITTILAQVVTTNIATPNSSGLSDNQVVSFDVNSDGTILNNSASDGTAQLGGTAVTANSNITADSEADLILLQVTGSTGSDLDGTIEVFGTEAGIIIANPNGIVCDGCGFINADRVDLVTGTYNITTGTYSISDNDFNVDGGGLLASNVGVLNIQTNNFTTIIGVGVTGDTFNLSVAGDFSNIDTSINVNTFNLSVAGDFTSSASGINVDTFNLSLAGDFSHSNYSYITANTFNLSLAGDFDGIVEYRNDVFYTNNNGRLFVNALNLNVDGDFSFSESANNLTLRANDSLTVLGSANITAASFNNSGAIDVDNSFNATVGTFINEAGATITAIGECNIVYTTSYTDNGTITCQNVVLETMVINIATPNSNGLSDNQVDDFDVNSYGTILNNSASDGTAQLGSTAVTANPNITAGSEADLILFQVTGSTVSSLDGTVEVFGGEAGIIIANPNGIACGGCGFINADRVDLVTGTYNIATETYSISDNDFTVDGGGLLANTVGVLNIQTNNFSNSGTSGIGVSADTFNLSVAGDFSSGGVGIAANTFNFSVAGDFTTGSSTVIIADTFNLSLAGDFTHGRYSEIRVNTFNFSLAGDFDHIVSYGADYDTFYTNNEGRIVVNAFNLNVGGDFTFSESANNFIWRANDNLTVLGDANITAADFNNSGTITANALNLSVAGDFDYRTDFLNAGTITADNLNFTARDGVFTNDTTIELAGNLGITANSFTNTGGVVSAATFALSVAGDFDYVAEYLNNGTITTDALNLNVGGNFTYDDSASNFTWATNDNLTVLGNADITTNNYTQSGAIDVDGVLTITANNYTYDRPNNDFVLAENDSLSILGDFTIATNNFNNSGSITTDSLNITAGYTAINQGSIVSNSLDLTTDDFFRNLTGGDISVDSLNITAGGKVTNTANITVAGTLSITANNDSTRTDDPAGAFFYVSNRGNITATTLNIAAVDNFYNRGNITTTSGFNTGARNIFFFNEEIDSFYDAGNEYDGGTITLGVDSSFIAGGAIENYGNIDLGVFNLDITADSFTNHANANVTADTLNLTVNSFINDGSIDAVIVSDTTIDQ